VRIAHDSLFIITDVGGVNKKDTTEDSNAQSNISLSNISLRWMVQEVMKSPCGVRFDEGRVGVLKRLHIPVKEIQRLDTPVKEIQAPLPEDEQPFNEGDAKVDIGDELKLTKCECESFWLWIGWWFLEVIVPTYYVWQEKRSQDGQTGEQWVSLWQVR